MNERTAKFILSTLTTKMCERLRLDSFGISSMDASAHGLYKRGLYDRDGSNLSFVRNEDGEAVLWAWEKEVGMPLRREPGK